MRRKRHRRICRVEQLENRELLTATGSLTHIVDSPEFGTVRLASGDLDGDGDLDILLADGLAGWKENTGSGEFRFRSDIGIGTDRSDAVAPFDVDDDGDLDVLSAYWFSVREGDQTKRYSEIGWHENVDGKGGFSAKRIIATVDAYVDGFDFVDIDADSDLDMVYDSRFGRGGPGWLENQNGLFSDIGLLVDHPTEFRFDLADIDGDNRVDLAVREELEGPILWYRNTSDGWILQNPLALHAFFSSWNFFDFDSDGDADYVDSTGIYVNDGDANYDLEIPFDYKSDHIFLFVPGATFEVVDVDSDGDPDVIYDGGSDGGVSDVAGIIRNQDGKFINTPLARDIYFSVEFGDFTGDSKLDLLHRSHRSTDGNLFLFDAFEKKRRVSDRTGPADSVIARDMDLDGDLDLIVSSVDYTGVNSDNRNKTTRLLWYENLGDMRFGPRQIIEEHPSDVEFGPSIRGDAGDVNGDGKLDVVSALGGELSIQLDYFGTPERAIVPDIGKRSWTDVRVQDVDGDSDLDILVSLNSRVEFLTLINGGSGDFTVESHPLVMSDHCGAGRWKDIDRDGDYDLGGFRAGYNIDGQRVETYTWLENVNGAFEPCKEIENYLYEDWNSEFADLDADGDIDRIESWRPVEIDPYHSRNGELRVHETRLIGDVNDDGNFDSTDLIAAFSAGEYEDGIANNSTFEEGDWNGDGEFNSADFVLAFQSGTFVREAAASLHPNQHHGTLVKRAGMQLFRSNDFAAASSDVQDETQDGIKARRRGAIVV